MDTERMLLSKMVQAGEVETVISRGIDEEHFADEECRDVFSHIINHTRRYKSPPSMQVVKEKFKGFEFELTSDSIEYLMDRFIAKVKRRFANELVMDLVEATEDAERSEQLDIEFLDASRQLATVVPSTQSEKFSDMHKRIGTYNSDKEKGNVWGIKFGIPQIDDKTFGIQPHELVVTAGWQGSGKSTLMQFFSFNAYLQGKRVLFISLEMEARALLRKFDAMAAELTYRDLKGLELGEEAIDRWTEWADRAEADAEERDIIIVDRIGSRTPTGIYAETVRYKPDLVVVDYLSLLQAPKGAGDKSWQQIGHLSSELKVNARMLGIPMLAAAQTNRESTKEGVKLETIAFSSSIGMDADIVIGLEQDEEMKVDKRMLVKMVKNRDGPGAQAELGWDLDTMQIGTRSPGSRISKKKGKSEEPAEAQEKKPEPKAEKKNPFRRD